MGGLPRGLILGALAWLAAATSAPAAQPAQNAAREVLVMLRMAPPHFRPDAAYANSYGYVAGKSALRRIAQGLAKSHGLSLVTDWPMPLLGVDCFVMIVPGDDSPAEVAAELSLDPQVAWSEPMHVYGAQSKPPNDPLFRLQPAARDWRLADLHEIATGRHVRVAVVDSMIDASHPDLAGQFDTRQNFAAERSAAPEQHGTGVAGVIAAASDNGVGVSGVAPGARLMALRACWQQPGSPATVCDTLSLAKAIHFAIEHDAQIINLSLSGPQDILLGRLLDVALTRRIILVGAVDADRADGGFPADHPGVVAVTDDPRAAAMTGAYLAPGRDVPTTQPGGRWGLVNGSSYSAAHVSGLFALLREHNPNGQSLAALAAARSSSGVIDACAMLLGASRPCNGCACSQPAKLSALARP